MAGAGAFASQSMCDVQCTWHVRGCAMLDSSQWPPAVLPSASRVLRVFLCLHKGLGSRMRIFWNKSIMVVEKYFLVSHFVAMSENTIIREQHVRIITKKKVTV